MNANFRSLAALGLCVIGATACLDTIDPVEANFALLNMHATQEGSDYRVSPVAFFFRASGVILSSSNRTQDLCGEVDWPATTPLQDLTYLDAGPFVTAAVSGSEATLHPRVVDGAETYELDAGSITHSPGDTVEFTIPAATAQLSAITTRARTADLFEPSVVEISQSSPDAVVLTWTPSPEDGSVMAYEFRYARQGSPAYDRELLCFLLDDGEANVSAALLAGFAGSNLRLAKATRQRISTFPGANTVVHITSTLELPVPFNVSP